MSIASTIAVSGMAAATLRLQVSASNVANALSSGPLPGSPAAGNFPGPYIAKRVDQVDIVGGGTKATVSNVSPGYVPKYDPSAPYADDHGMVASPDVDLANEFVQQMIARYTFAANVQVIKTEAKMMAALFDAMA